MKRFLIILILSTTAAFAEDDQCAYFKYCGAASAPTKKSNNTSTSASINPSNIAKIKGLGLETLFQANNPLTFSLVTGNGKVGAAFISSSVDNSFFGVRALELDDKYFQRYEENKRYKNNKLNFAVGVSLVETKNVDMALGLSVKRNSEIGQINPGAGFSARFAFLNIGAYVFKDDVKIDLTNEYSPYTGQSYSLLYNSNSYQENYLVKTFTVGIKIKNFSLDVASINTHYKFYNDDTKIMIYTAAYTFGKFMVNYAHRIEHSPNLAYNKNYYYAYNNFYGNSISNEKDFNYAGVQFMATKNFMFGLAYNAFLLNELSGTITIFLN